jgi:hypothetical protein
MELEEEAHFRVVIQASTRHTGVVDLVSPVGLEIEIHVAGTSDDTNTTYVITKHLVDTSEQVGLTVTVSYPNSRTGWPSNRTAAGRSGAFTPVADDNPAVIVAILIPGLTSEGGGNVEIDVTVGPDINEWSFFPGCGMAPGAVSAFTVSATDNEGEANLTVSVQWYLGSEPLGGPVVLAEDATTPGLYKGSMAAPASGDAIQVSAHDPDSGTTIAVKPCSVAAS